MNQKKFPQLPDAELDVMMTLWQRGEPSLVSDIHQDLQQRRKCTKPAVHILLDRLAAKDFVRIDVVETPIAYKLVTALVSEQDYCAAASETFLTKICRGSWKRLIANLVDAGEISGDDLEEIARIIGQKGQE